MRCAKRKSGQSRRRRVTPERVQSVTKVTRRRCFHFLMMRWTVDPRGTTVGAETERRLRGWLFAWNTIRISCWKRTSPRQHTLLANSRCVVPTLEIITVSIRWAFSLITRGRLPACSRSPRITMRSLKNYCLITVKSFVSYFVCMLASYVFGWKHALHQPVDSIS